MLLEGGLLHAQRRLQLQSIAPREMSSGHKLKTKKSLISYSRNHCQNITYYDIKLDGSMKILILNMTAAAQQFLNQNRELILYYEK